MSKLSLIFLQNLICKTSIDLSEYTVFQKQLDIDYENVETHHNILTFKKILLTCWSFIFSELDYLIRQFVKFNNPGYCNFQKRKSHYYFKINEKLPKQIGYIIAQSFKFLTGIDNLLGWKSRQV